MDIQEKIAEWKKEFGSVYKAMFDNTAYYFRNLSREEFLSISQKQLAEEGFDSERETVKVCVLEPIVDDKHLSYHPGIITILSEQIMVKSGFQQVEVEEL
jgi:hypothetical protein